MRISGILLSTAILSFCFASQSQAQSQVYRSTDAEGNVTFSDQPSANSAKEDIPETNVGDAVKVPPPEPVVEPKVVAEQPPAAPEGRLVGIEKDSRSGRRLRKETRRHRRR
jgi:hypothetical protein